MNWKLAYAIGFHPWEDTDPPFAPRLSELLDSEEKGRDIPYGPALDLGPTRMPCSVGRERAADFEAVRLIVAWCELRQAFRHFRTDRILSAEFLGDGYSPSTEALRAAWRAEQLTRGCVHAGEKGCSTRQ